MIDKNKRELSGSNARDKFKQLHKEKLADNCYSLDIDFAFVEKNQQGNSDHPLIVAICDFKKPGDAATFTEVLAYNQFLEMDIPVYIVSTLNENFESEPANRHRFDIEKYLGGDWRKFPPEYSTKTIYKDIGWSGLSEWESDLRIKRRNEVKEKHD